jgi:SAM-dependent methyltransferase
MTLLIQKYLGYRVTPANFFEDYGASAKPGEHLQPVASTAFGEDHIFRYRMFNIERDPFPYPDASFDLVLCCEILEHLVMDPSHMLREAHRVLKPGGHIFLSTPNVCSLDNIRNLLRGRNLFHAYSGYGVYGRHNREYTPRELADLLSAHHFAPAVSVEDVYPHDRCHRWLTRRGPGRAYRDNLFAVGTASGDAVQRHPDWLYWHQWGRPRARRECIVMGDGDLLQLGTGWHNFEDWPPVVRWSNREAIAFLTLPAVKRAFLKIRAWAGPSGATGTVAISGSDPYPFALDPGGPQELSIPLPSLAPADDGTCPLEIRLSIDSAFVPALRDGGGDTRELGIAVERLWLD